MSIEGRIAIDIGFTDMHTTEGVQNVQRIALSQTDAFTAGKVAVLSGTLGTSVILFYTDATGFIAANGQAVSFGACTRLYGEFSRPCSVQLDDATALNQTVFLVNTAGEHDIAVTPSYTSGTASYTIFMYGT